MAVTDLSIYIEIKETHIESDFMGFDENARITETLVRKFAKKRTTLKKNQV